MVPTLLWAKSGTVPETITFRISSKFQGKNQNFEKTFFWALETCISMCVSSAKPLIRKLMVVKTRTNLVHDIFGPRTGLNSFGGTHEPR